MNFSLAKNVFARMTAKGLTIKDMQKKFSIQYSSIRGILNGHSKNPTASLLQRVASALSCSIEELVLKDAHIEESFLADRTKELEKQYEHHELFIAVAVALNKKLEDTGKQVTVEQYIACVEEIFIHSLQKDPHRVDLDYLEWFVNLIEFPDHIHESHTL